MCRTGLILVASLAAGCASGASERSGDELELHLLLSGGVRLNGTVRTEEELRGDMEKAYRSDPDVRVLITGDRKLPYSRVAAQISMLRDIGIRHARIKIADPTNR